MRAIRKVSHWDFHPHVRSGDQRTLGEKCADVMRRSMGSWPFVFAFCAIMAGWMWYNSTTHHPFDAYPYILLNLCLSTLAGLQGAILLIAAKRADRIAAELAEYHLQVSEDHKQMLAELTQLLQQKN
jgi:uncharacterized membrane protein